jgi:hypothetical protein
MNVRVLEVHIDLVLCGVADQTFVVREGEIGSNCAISLVVCNDSIIEQTALIQIVIRPLGVQRFAWKMQRSFEGEWVLFYGSCIDG